jgi:hypothetical protein
MEQPKLTRWEVAFICPETDGQCVVVAWPDKLLLHTNNTELIVNCPRCKGLHSLVLP